MNGPSIFKQFLHLICLIGLVSRMANGDYLGLMVIYFRTINLEDPKFM